LYIFFVLFVADPVFGEFSLFVKQDQLSQRTRMTLRVIEYFAKSLKVIRNNALD